MSLSPARLPRGVAVAAPVLLLAAFVLLLATGSAPAPRAWLLPAGSAVAGVTVLASAYATRPDRNRGWTWLGAVFVPVTVGNAVQASAGTINGTGAACFFLAYPLAVRALWLLAGSSRDRRSFGMLDATVALVTVAGLDYQFLVGPAIDRPIAVADKLGAGVMPAIDLVLLALLLRVLVTGTRRVRSFWLLLAGSVANLLSDLCLSVTSLHGTYRPGTWPDGFSLVMYALLGMAAAHPTMPQVGRTARQRTQRPMGALLLLVPAGCVVPALLVADALGWLTVQPIAGALVSLALFQLALGRAFGVVRASERLASWDELTGLPNRRHFQQLLATLVAGPAAAEWSVGFLDLDDFKTVNDTHGHETGDDLIRSVAQRLRTALPPGDVLARFGGDELCLLLHGPGAEETSRRILAALEAPFLVGGTSIRVGASLGLVVGLHGGDAERSLSDADVAMYAAKQGGGGLSVYREGLRASVLGGGQLAADLAAALADPVAGGLWVAYQPVVLMTSGKMTGCEALARWDHPTRGPVSPVEFVAVAERAGLAARLDEYVLRTALAQFAAWTAEHPALCEPLAVGVNLSRASLTRPGLVATILDALGSAGVPATKLVLEITEHEELPEVAQVAESLQALAALGVIVALDDFGTGYTSMVLLDRFPIAFVKVDRSVVSTVVDGVASPLVVGLAAFARSLGLLLLAEGLETPDQVCPLRELGFLTAQGWNYAPAGPPEALIAFALEQGTGGLGPDELPAAA